MFYTFLRDGVRGTRGGKEAAAWRCSAGAGCAGARGRSISISSTNPMPYAGGAADKTGPLLAAGRDAVFDDCCAESLSAACAFITFRRAANNRPEDCRDN